MGFHASIPQHESLLNEFLATHFSSSILHCGAATFCATIPSRASFSLPRSLTRDAFISKPPSTSHSFGLWKGAHQDQHRTRSTKQPRLHAPSRYRKVNTIDLLTSIENGQLWIRLRPCDTRDRHRLLVAAMGSYNKILVGVSSSIHSKCGMVFVRPTAIVRPIG